MSNPRENERGAVVVMVAVMLPLFALLLAFAIDTGHWWTHDRHLQTQADAGALAGAFGPWLPTCDEAAIEAAARQYAGDQSSGAPFNSQYSNAANVHVLINSTNYWNEGGADFSDGGTPCQTLASAGEGKPGFLDLKLTEASLLNLFGGIPGFNSVTINRHARVEIQKAVLENNVRPIAIRDDSAYQCAQVLLYRENSDGSAGTQYGSPITLSMRTVHDPDSSDPTSYTEYQNPLGTAQITMPSPAQNLLVRIALFGNKDSSGACTGSSDVYPQDSSGSPVGGVNFINVYSTAGPTGTSPALHSVWLSNGSCSPDQYFSSQQANPATPDPCIVTVNANVEFPAGATNQKVKINGTDAQGGLTSWSLPVSIDAQSSANEFDISWSYKDSSNHNRSGDFGVQQQAYAGTNDDSLASNSGAITLMKIGDGGAGTGANSFVKGGSSPTPPNLVFTVRVAGLANSLPWDPPIVLRYAVQGQTNSKRTGIVDCWSDNSGAQNVHDAIVNGCGRGIYLWTPGTDCVAPDTTSNKPPLVPIDCVGVVPGNKRNQVKQGIVDRMGGSCNYWNAYRDSHSFNIDNYILPNDPRKVTLIITPPADLSGGGGSTADVPVVKLATFYVTGWDGAAGNGQNCNNEAFPGSGSSKNAIWGHWIQYVEPGGEGSGEACIPNEFGDCVAVLTQ
jgi:hypothetical protein